VELRREVCQFVERAKEQQRPPEKIIVELKAIAGTFGFTGQVLGADRGGREALLSEIVGWCIEHYFRDAR
jgi:hypothetical protein